MAFSPRCDMHGSKTIASVKAAKRQEVLSTVTRVELIASANPILVLQDLLNEAVEMKQYASERMGALESLRYSSSQGFEQVRGEWQFWSSSFDKVAKLATLLVDLGLDELKRTIDLARAQEVYACYVAGLKAVPEISEAQDQALRTAFAFQLRARIPVGTIGTLEANK
jgi:hypothetical protein